MEINVQNGVGAYDANMVLNDASADSVTSTTGVVGTTGTGKVATVRDFGAKVRADGNLVIVVSANSVIPGAKQTIKLQGSNDGFVGDIVDLVTKEFGDAADLPGNVDIGPGKYVIPYSNVVGATAYQKVRAWSVVNEPSPNSPANHITHITYLVPNNR